MYKEVLLLLAFFSGLISCQDTLQTNMQKYSYDEVTKQDGIYYKNGKPITGIITNDKPIAPLIQKEEFSVREGLLDGTLRQWIGGGVLRMEKNYRDGLEAGVQRGYHTNGKLSYLYEAKAGEKEGSYKEYYPSGLLHIEMNYLQGKIIGKKILDRNGVTLTNYKIKEGRYYGLLGSSSCINVLNEDNEIEN